MRKLFLILCTLCPLLALAQYNNEWIDYSKTYYKFKVGETGLYRISQAALAGIGLGATDAAHFQLWRNGEQVPVYTSSQSGALSGGGYIEFWGEANDGKPDNALYRNPAHQINNSKSLFTDTAVYFLTVNPAGPNRRLAPVATAIPAGAVPEPYFLHTVSEHFNEQIHLGQPYGEGGEAVYPASYESAEGWASNDISNGGTRAFSKSNLFVYTGGGAPEVSINMNVTGNSYAVRNVRLTLNNAVIFDTAFSNFNFLKLTGTAPLSLIAPNNASFVVANVAATTNRIRVAQVQMTYPRTFNFGGASSFRFQAPSKTAGTYFEISGFNTSGGTTILYDLSNGKRYTVDATTPALLKVFTEPGAGTQDLLLVNDNATNVKNITAFETRNFVDYSAAANQGDYLIITHKALLTGPNNTQPVEEYRAYRQTATGGAYNAKIYLIDQIVDQFGFGIKQNPLAVRNFLRWARSRFTRPLQYVYIVGKGVDYYNSKNNENAAAIDRLNLVPTFGYPASDVLLSAEGASSMPLTPIGRVSVISGDELQTYLAKVKQYEQQLTSLSPLIEESSWKKDVIHIVGANDLYTIDLLSYYLNNHKQVIKDTFYGASVTDYIKSLSAGAEELNSVRLANQINNGIGLLTYLGHSSATSLAFKIENPNNYNNHGKYPIFNMLGCNVGNIFSFNPTRLVTPETVSEKYLLANERGSIAMLAGTSLGYTNNLDFYNLNFYRNLAELKYGAGLGEVMQNTMSSIFGAMPEESNFSQRILCEAFVLNGDPAIATYHFSKPDYAIEDRFLKVSPGFISVADTEFALDYKIFNIGKAINREIVVEIKRTFPDQSTAVIRRDTIAGIRYADSLRFVVPVDPVKDKGMNKITITIDPDNEIDELFETNNTISRDVFIYENDIRPVFPYDYSIVNRQQIVFAASTANPLATTQNYLMEIDTTRLFNSPLKISLNKTSAGGLVEFAPGITFRDNTVYYWRVAAAPASSADEINWNYSSFTYFAAGDQGFNQSHYYQFDGGTHDRIFIDSTGKFLFKNLKSSITVNNAFYPYASSSIDFSLQIEEVYKQVGFISSPLANPQQNSLRFYLMNNRTLQPVFNKNMGSTGMYGSYLPAPWNASTVLGFFQFDISTTAARKTVMDFLDSIPSGYYVGLTSAQWIPTILPSVWKSDTAVLGKNNSLYHKLKSIGLSAVDSIQPHDTINTLLPYVFIYQKDNKVPLAQVVGKAVSDKLVVTVTVNVPDSVGSIRSPRFSKVEGWKTLSWDGYSLENSSADKAFVSVIGIDKNGSESVLMSDIPASQQTADLSSISAETYPALRFEMRTEDLVDRTPYQLRYWRVNGKPVPEGAIAPNIFYSKKDTLQLGEPLNIGVAFKNVSDQPFDSLKVRVIVRDRNNVENNIAVPDQKALVAGDTIRLNVPIETRNFIGHNSLFVEFNPLNVQPEQVHVNNFLNTDFYVIGDSLNPYLDVTFDGMHILNKDIVSSKPDVLIKLTDDSKWMLIDNPDLVKVQLRHPDGITREYKYDSDTLRFNPPGTSGENTATINFKPYLQQDGNYELIISAKDQSGNTAGDMQYRVNFQVINKQMISNLLNYPNPFTTSTAFVFTLTGSEIPQNIRIQIMTITGKIVKEITKAELGPLKIGRNITKYKWDGTDQYGQKLANGVYLYRVITNHHGKSLEKYRAENDNTDRYFKGGYGKMYLMR